MFYILVIYGFCWHNAGTDDDIPPSHQNRYANVGRASANGRSAVVGVASLGTAPFPPVHSDMEEQIHQIEQEAYSSVLRAFKAQSDAITWVCIFFLFSMPMSNRVTFNSF